MEAKLIVILLIAALVFTALIVILLIAALVFTACTVQLCTKKQQYCVRAPCPPVTTCQTVYTDGKGPVYKVTQGKVVR